MHSHVQQREGTIPMTSPKRSKAKTGATAEPVHANLAITDAGARRDVAKNAATPENRADSAEDSEAHSKEALDREVLPSIRRDQQAELVFKLKSRRRGRDDRPLARLALKEAECQQASTARAQLLRVRNKSVDPTLVAHQLSTSVDTQITSDHLAKQMRSDAHRLYTALDSGDPIESILDRILVASTNVTLGCYQRAVSGHSNARQVELRWGMRGAEVIGNLIKLRDSRRGSGHQNVTVGNLKVEPGGQAIVGNVNTGKTDEDSER
jgi:hypothetical protein